MPFLVVKYPGRAPENFSLGRLRITIGRSARNDLCIPDPFASRVHAEVRREADGYVLQDLGSANGTYYNGQLARGALELASGGKIQIGETEIEFRETESDASSTQTAIVATGGAAQSLPAATISLNSSSDNRTTSGLLEAIEGARTFPRARDTDTLQAKKAPDSHAEDLLALIGKVGVTLLASATLDETLRQVVMLVFDAVPAERCLVMMRDDKEGELRVRAAEVRAGGASKDAGEIRISRAIISEVVEQGRSILASDAQHDPRFSGSTVTFQNIRSVLAAPLGVGSEIFGIIYADSPVAETAFTEDHLKVLTTLASVAAIRVENARLQEERLEHHRLEQELYLAREIQQRLQPAGPPEVPGYDLLGISFPSRTVGGDYYDFIRREDGRMVIALGDVSGKGTGAALLMSSLHAAIHAQAASHRSIAETITAVNRYLAASIPSNRFVTLFYAELDPHTGGVAFLNAGHNPPLIVHAAGTIEHLAAGGMPLGISADAEFREGRTQLQPGDALVIYSDGVTETNNPCDEEFGVDRLQKIIVNNLERSAAGIRDRIEAELSKFAEGTPAADDITLVIVKRQAKAAAHWQG
jgi:phosphoserine phosphatase RsbU/P